MCEHCSVGEDGDCQCDEVAKLRAEIARLREELRWIPVTEKLPPEDGTDVDFLSLRGYDGYGHMYRQTKEISDQLLLPHNPEPVMIEYEAGPYHIGKDPRGSWEVTHWRLRPGTQPDFDKFIKENT